MAQSPVARLERSERGVTGAPWESLKHLGAEKMVWVVMIRCDEFSRKTRVLVRTALAYLPAQWAQLSIGGFSPDLWAYHTPKIYLKGEDRRG